MGVICLVPYVSEAQVVPQCLYNLSDTSVYPISNEPVHQGKQSLAKLFFRAMRGVVWWWCCQRSIFYHVELCSRVLNAKS